MRCQHAGGDDREYIEKAIEAGYKILGFSDHAPFVFENDYVSPVRMKMSELDEYVSTLQRLKKEYEKDIKIFIGLEAEYWPKVFDIRRVYLTGNSMGGYGTWELASLRPDWFASIMPVCGGGIKWMAYALVDVPARAFHGLCDTVVDPIESLEMTKAVNRCGGHAELILFPKLEHNCWDKVYSTEENYDWLLTFSTDRDKTLIEQYSGSYYG